MRVLYDTIGLNYSELRRPDPRIAARIAAALGEAQTVLNVGAGTGSYEPADRQMVAVEPSLEMIRQRAPGAAPAVRAAAENLPFADDSFDASMAILTLHHWADKAKGLAEMRRVTRGRIVLLTFDAEHRGGWLSDYLPELAALDDVQMPPMADYERWLGPVRILPVPIPHDCTDGFLHAYWRRPRAYLDERIRSAISSVWKVGDVGPGLRRLAEDLESGEWRRRYAHLVALDQLDLGYRLVVAG